MLEVVPCAKIQKIAGSVRPETSRPGIGRARYGEARQFTARQFIARFFHRVTLLRKFTAPRKFTRVNSSRLKMDALVFASPFFT